MRTTLRTRTGTVALAATLGLGGLATGVVLAPAMAVAASSDATAGAALADRVSKVKDALKGLVSDGTLTQAQADKVATALADQLPAHRGPGGHLGPGGPGMRGGAPLEAAATILKLTPQELRTALESGKTLAQVAQAQGVSKTALVQALVTAAEKRLAEAVTAGHLTQAQADERKADLTARITELVDRTGPVFKGRHRHPHQEPATAPSTGEAATPEAGTASL